MDWALAIERHRVPLLRIVAGLFAMIGLSEGGTGERLAWPLYRAVLRVQRPAEAAVRRLIIVAAQGMVVKPSPVRPASAGRKRSGKGQSRRRVLFQLVDPRQRFAPPRQKKRAVVRAEPCIRVLDFDPRVPLFAKPGVIAPAPALKRMPRDTANAGPLCRRLAAIKEALEDLPPKPGAMPAGGPSPWSSAGRSLSRRFAQVLRQVIAKGQRMRSMRS